MQAVLEQSLITESVINRAEDSFGRKIGFFATLFGCWHNDMSRPFTKKGKPSYRACTDCGARRKFNTKSLTTHGPFYYPPSVASDRI